MIKDYVHGNDGWMSIRWQWLQAGYQTLLPYRVKVEIELILGDIAITISGEKMNEKVFLAWGKLIYVKWIFINISMIKFGLL